MKVLACIAVVPVLLVGWLWHTDRSTERRLAPIASEIAGRDVEVDCQSLAGALLDAQAREGEVRYSPEGIPEARLFLTRKQCGRLRSFADKAYHAELDCLRAIDWRRPLELLPGMPCHDEASPTIYALLILAHEAYHTAGVTSESLTNCYAIQAMGFAAVRLGAAESEAVSIARAMAVLLPHQGGEYSMSACLPGSRYDLWPATPAFPTELPVEPPMGRGGMEGLAFGAGTRSFGR